MFRILHALLLAGAFFVFTQPAEAFVYSHGEEIELVQDLPDTPEYFNEGEHWDLGYMYYQYDLLFMPVWASDAEGRFVLYAGDRYIDLPPEALAELQSVVPGKDDLTAGYDFNPLAHMWGLIIWLPPIALGLLSKFRGRNSGAPMAAAGEETDDASISTDSFDAKVAARLRQPAHDASQSPEFGQAPAGGFGRKGV